MPAYRGMSVLVAAGLRGDLPASMGELPACVVWLAIYLGVSLLFAVLWVLLMRAQGAVHRSCAFCGDRHAQAQCARPDCRRATTDHPTSEEQ